jgi:hypothetical protein
VDTNTEEANTKMPNKTITKYPNKYKDKSALMYKAKQKRKEKQDATVDKKMECMFTTIKEDTQKQLNEQAKKNAEQLAEMKQTNMEAQHILTHKYIATSTTHDHKSSIHFNAITKACDIIFDEQPERWSTSESHLLNEAGNPTIGWSNELLSFPLMGQTEKSFKYIAFQCTHFRKIPPIIQRIYQQDPALDDHDDFPLQNRSNDQNNALLKIAILLASNACTKEISQIIIDSGASCWVTPYLHKYKTLP